MIEAQTTQLIRASPEQILEFVMDIERYAEIDAKIRPVLWSRRNGNVTEFACRSRVGGMPGPKVVQEMRLIPGRRIDIVLTGGPENRLARAMGDFQASFECQPVAGGTQVNRVLQFRLKWPTSWILGPRLRRRLPGEVDEELLLAKHELEKPAAE